MTISFIKWLLNKCISFRLVRTKVNIENERCNNIEKMNCLQIQLALLSFKFMRFFHCRKAMAPAMTLVTFHKTKIARIGDEIERKMVTTWKYCLCLEFSNWRSYVEPLLHYIYRGTKLSCLLIVFFLYFYAYFSSFVVVVNYHQRSNESEKVVATMAIWFICNRSVHSRSRDNDTSSFSLFKHHYSFPSVISRL